MNDNNQVGFSRIEWESFNNKIEVKKIEKSKLIPEGAETLEIWRDESYKLQGKIIGSNDGLDLFHREDKNKVAGTIVPSFEIEGSDYYGLKSYKLSHCYIVSSSTKAINLDSKPQDNFEIKLKPYRVEKHQNSGEKVDWLIEWYINGPSGNFIFPRLTEREIKEEYIRKRYDFEERSFSGANKSEVKNDFAFIELGDFNFIIQVVPKHFGPSWSNNIAIEYREEWGGIPREEDREAIREIVSFILGKQLLNVGYSTFNDMGYPINEVAIDPWGDNIVSKCKEPSLFPIMIDDYNNRGIIEQILKNLIPTYLEIRDDLNLEQALWSYWVSLDLPIGINLPILSSGIEAIAKGWFKTNKSKTKGVYLSKKEYDSILSNEINAIEEKLKNIEYGEKMINKIKNAFNMGANDRLRFFFNEIGLKIGNVEEQTIKARNSMAHGDKINDEEMTKMLNLTYSFQTLFHRVLLMVLDYDGNYIDRSTYGWPEKNITEPLGGNI